jgi:phospholipase A1
MTTEIVVLVPGIMGSVLEDDEGVVWPGSLAELLLPYDKMDRLTNPDLRPTDVIRDFGFTSQYSSLLRTIASWGFEENKRLFVCPYDWRKDNLISARTLADKLDTIVESLGNDVVINLVGHSMGGVVSRLYLESGDFTARNAFKKVVRLVALATPHRGSLIALTAALGQEGRLFLNEKQVKSIANDSRFPALYQLMPFQGEDVLWDIAPGQRVKSVDIYDASFGTTFNLNPLNIAAAIALQAKLNVLKKPPTVTYFFFSGSSQETSTHAQISGGKIGAYTRADGGDGTVPSWSSALPGVQRAVVGGSHGTIYKDVYLCAVLGALLGAPVHLAAFVRGTSLSVRDQVMPSESIGHVVIEFASPKKEIRGILKIVKLTDAAGKSIEETVVTTVPVKYTGAPLERLGLTIVAPTYPGGYRIHFLEDDQAAAVASDDFLVQLS